MRGVGEYPENWNEVAETVKRGAAWRCVRCGHRAFPPFDGRVCDAACSHPRDGKQRMLTVHHLDGNKANCRWWNLVALCQVCHLQIQGRVIMAQTWPFDHSGWMKPHAAGFYASTILGEDLSRQETMARLGELLALGQPDQWGPSR